jgi:hypothetical protein
LVPAKAGLGGSPAKARVTTGLEPATFMSTILNDPLHRFANTTHLTRGRPNLRYTLVRDLNREERPSMPLEVIGAEFGRTGTMSLKLALEELSFGPC